MRNLDIIGIGGNESEPNPRLPSYLIDNLKENFNDILLTSSVDSSIKNNPTEKGKILTEFNTDQKIKLIQEFTEKFYPDKFKNLKIDFSPKTNKIEDKQWLEFWTEIESNMTSKEKEETHKILERFNRTGNSEKGKIYSARHPFWFKDLTLPGEDKSIEGYENKSTYGGKQEGFFNFIRNKSLEICDNKLRDIFGEEVTKNKIDKIITEDSNSKIVPYGEATTGKNNSKRSIEYPIGNINQKYSEEYKLGDIKGHYEQKRQKKAGLNHDINKIITNVNIKEYQDFFENFSEEYKQDLKNI